MKKTNRINKITKKRNFGFTFVAAIAILAIIAVAIFYSSKTVADTTLATVNGVPITQKQIDKLYVRLPAQYQNPAVKSLLLNQSIDELLFLSEASKNGIAVSDNEADRQFQEALENQGLTEQQVSQSLASYNITIADIKADLKKQLIIFRMINETIISQTSVTEQEIWDFYVASGGTNDTNLTITNTTKQQIKSIILEDKVSKALTQLLKKLRSEADIKILKQP